MCRPSGDQLGHYFAPLPCVSDPLPCPSQTLRTSIGKRDAVLQERRHPQTREENHTDRRTSRGYGCTGCSRSVAGPTSSFCSASVKLDAVPMNPVICARPGRNPVPNLTLNVTTSPAVHQERRVKTSSDECVELAIVCVSRTWMRATATSTRHVTRS